MKQLQKQILTDIPIWMFIIINISLICYEFHEIKEISNIEYFIMYITLIPAIILIIFKIIIFCINNKLLNITIKCFRILFIIVSILFYLIIYLIISGISVNSSYYTPSIKEYNTRVKKISNKEYRLRHFPEEIPKNAQNYYFKIEFSFDGYDINYLKFNTNKEYTDNVIKENQNNIYKILPYIRISEYYKYIESTLSKEIPFENRENYTAYILKNENNDYKYTSGFIVSKEMQEIIYFYADFNLEDNENKENKKNNN